MSTGLLLLIAVLLLVIAAVSAAKRRVTVAVVTGLLGISAAVVWLAETQGWVDL